MSALNTDNWRGVITMDYLAGERRRAQVSQTVLAEALGMTRARLATLETSNDYILPSDHFADEWMVQIKAATND